MATTLCNQIRTAVDEATGGVFFTDQHVYDAANAALVDMWAESARDVVPIAQTSTDLVLTSNVDLVTWPITTIMIPQYLVYNGNEYYVTDQAKLEQWSRNWKTNTLQQPKWFVAWDHSHLRVFPRPDTAYTFKLYGIPWPTEIGVGAEDLAADPRLVQAVAYRGAANLLSLTRPDLADQMEKDSDEVLQAYKRRLRNQQGHQITRLAPGNRYSAAFKGVPLIGRRIP